MTDLGSEQPDVPLRRWRPRWRLVLVGVLLVAILALALLWVQRREIATGFIERELARRGVAARYRVTQIGFRTQRLEGVVIGDPARPDLSAKLVEVEIAVGLGGPRVALVRGRGVRAFGRIVDGRLTLGEIDKLLPPPSDAPFQLPDLAIDVADTAMRLETPAGRIGLSLRGRGNLASGFRGKLAAISPALTFGECRIERAVAVVDLATDNRRPGIKGPVRAWSATCPDLALTRPQIAVDTRLGPALDSWTGDARVTLPLLAASGARIENLAGPLSFAGSMERTRGTMDLAAGRTAFADVRAEQVKLAGRYDASPARGRFSLRADAAGQGVAMGDATLSGVTSALASTGGTPLEPIGASLSEAVRRAGRSLDVRGALAFTTAGHGALRIERLTANSRSGATLSVSGGSGLTWFAGPGVTQLDGTVALSGGGFPGTQLVLSQPRPGVPIRGVGQVAPMAAGDARLTIAPIRFVSAADGTTRVETTVLASGPMGDGYVSNLAVPLSGRFGRGGFAIGDSCVTARFASLRTAGLVLGPTRLPVCPTGQAIVYSAGRGVSGGARIASPHLTGRLGGSPIDLRAATFLFSVDRSSFEADRLAIRVASAAEPHRLDIGRLSGTFAKTGVEGRFSDTSGKLANVPLVVDYAGGTWRMVGSRLDLTADLTVSDAEETSRFYMLASRDFRLRFADNRIEARGSLTDPETVTHVADVTIRHSLDSGRGRADFEVPNLVFSPEFQPDELTRYATGVVALVDGTVRGRGGIEWSPEGVTSNGTFSTENMNLAASFGPVEGLTTTIHFTDLLGLATAPGQVATTKLIQAGIDVYDGTIRYQLLPDLKVRVEGGRWPYSGGELLLEDTTLDFSKPSEKHLTFRVVGLDGARFIAEMEFDNIAATGLLDGVVPMIFDERGGRIVGGHLEARPEGGTLSYIGELTDKDLGAYGKLAFDALKALSYERLVIDLNGALDGEFVTTIELDGIAREMTAGPPASSGLQAIIARRALSQIAKIPFEFNITIRGPFRTLMATARSLEDPSLLIQTALPEELQNQPISTVQPQESEPVQ